MAFLFLILGKELALLKSRIEEIIDIWTVYLNTFLLQSSNISEDVSLSLNSFTKFLIDQFFDDFLQELFIDSELFVSSLLSHLEELLKGAVHVMVVGMFQGLDHCALNDELSFSLDTFLIIVESSDFFVKSSFEFFWENKDISFDNGHGFGRRSFWSFLSLLFSNEIIVSVDFKFISLWYFADVGSARFDRFCRWDQQSRIEQFKDGSGQFNNTSLFVDTGWLNFLLEMTVQNFLFFIDEQENEEMQVFELESLFLSCIELSLENGNTSVKFKEDVGVLSLEVFQKRIVWLEEDSGRIFDVICTSFRPIICIFDDDLIERISTLLFDVAF